MPPKKFNDVPSKSMRAKSVFPEATMLVEEFTSAKWNERCKAATYFNSDQQGRQSMPVFLHDGPDLNGPTVNPNRPIDIEVAFYSSWGPSVFSDKKTPQGGGGGSGSSSSSEAAGTGASGSKTAETKTGAGSAGAGAGDDKGNNNMSIGAALRQSRDADEMAKCFDSTSAREAYRRLDQIWTGKRKPESVEVVASDYMKSCRVKPKDKAGKVDDTKLQRYGETLYLSLRKNTEIRVNGSKTIMEKGVDGKPDQLRPCLPSDIERKGGHYRACVRYEGFKITGSSQKEISPKFWVRWIDHVEDMEDDEPEVSRLPTRSALTTKDGSGGGAGDGDKSGDGSEGENNDGEEEEGEVDESQLSPLSRKRRHPEMMMGLHKPDTCSDGATCGSGSGTPCSSEACETADCDGRVPNKKARVEA